MGRMKRCMGMLISMLCFVCGSWHASLGRMVAVTPYLEESLDQPVEGAQRYVYKMDSAAQIEGLGAAQQDPLSRPAIALDKTHQNLARLAASREIANRLLDGRQMYVSGGKLVVSPPIKRDEAPPWAGLSSDWSGSGLLSWVGKMQCPSFSLPAGAFENGGSCPAAALGQTTADAKNVQDLADKAQILRKTVGDVQEFRKNALPVWYALSTCQTCYAEAGSYGYFSTILSQTSTLAWTRWALKTQDEEDKNGKETVFVSTLIQEIERADYGTPSATDLAHLASASEAHGLPKARGYKRFFRWHDAGDIIGLEYFEQVKRICDHFNPRKGGKGTPTLFWIPTRIWARKGSQKWSAVNDDPSTNIVLRPSAFHVNFPAPSTEEAGPGNSAGSTTIAEPMLEKLRDYFDHDCPAAGQKKSTCVTTGCRACWVKPDSVINYRLH